MSIRNTNARHGSVLTDKWFIVLNMFVGALRVCAASGLLMMRVFID